VFIVLKAMRLLLGRLGHGVESATVLEPLDLALVEGVRQRDVESLAAVGGLDDQGHGLANSKLSDLEVDLVVGANLVVVGGVGEGERKHTLLLQVGLVLGFVSCDAIKKLRGGTYNTGERSDNDGQTSQMPGLESSVLTGRALTVVPVTNNDPLDAVLLVVTGDVRDGTVLSVERVLDLVGLAVLSVDGTDQHVVGDVVQMSTVLQPGTGHGDVVGGGLALGLDEDGQVGGVLAVPGVERLEELQTVGGGRNGNVDGRAVRGRVLVGVLSWVVSVGGQTQTGWRLELELLAVCIRQFVNKGVDF
jgi:hypothetical protein